MIRAKFTCQENTVTENNQIATVILDRIRPDVLNADNLIFWIIKVTPDGSITLSLHSSEIWNQFSEGADYYLEFTAAERTLPHSKETPNG